MIEPPKYVPFGCEVLIYESRKEFNEQSYSNCRFEIPSDI